MTKPTVLCILDGWGLKSSDIGNAPALAKTPVFDHLMQTCPSATLVTHGPDAGLPTGQMGNSEVGHTNIGAGRVVAMDLGQIDLSIEDGSFQQNAAILDFANTVKAGNGTAHLIGLVSDGGVHSHLAHLIAATQILADQGVRTVVHAIIDGRDVAPKSALTYLAHLRSSLPSGVDIKTVSGRYFALDRDNRWDRVQKAYDVIAQGVTECIGTPEDGITDAYAQGITDEFIAPFKAPGYDGMVDGDGVFFLNFRSDRAREIMAALADPAFSDFDITGRPTLSACLGMVSYSDSHDTYMTTAFPKRNIPNTLGEWVSKQGKRQFRLAETEKYPHVTFFLNGGVETPYPGEDRFMPPSPKVATYDLQPEMSAAQVTEQFVAAIHQGYDLVVTNFANPDMVG
ncbi:MAG: 2,3-bisphosphoglycerate-independent phosphoglycerate mutase, partial [Pseudomonadota bacterium]